MMRTFSPLNRILLGGFVLALSVSASFEAALAVVPFRPDVLDRLRAEGTLPAMVQGMEDARNRGLGNPAATARGWLRQPADGERAVNDRQAIVILVDFSDNVANQALYPPAHYNNLLFSVGTYPTGSMRDWYLENSYGAFHVTGAVTVWLRMPQTYAYYVDGQAGFGTYPHNAQKLAEDAVAAANPSVDFSQYDNDGPDGIPSSGDDDGFVDALFIVHAGPGREETGSNNDIHSHASGMVVPQVVDGVTAFSYSMEPDNGKRGVFGHEFGHVLGLPDLYDSDYSSSGVGDWCMMSFGSWGNGGLTPVHFLSWCKQQLNFLTPTTPLTNANGISLPRVETSPTAYTLWTGGYPGDQYFVVENRQRVGSDVSLPGDGLIICHVDESISGNTDENHPLIAVEQADGLNELAQGGASDNGDPWPGSTNNRNFDNTSNPNTRDYAGNPTQVAVRAISGSAAIMTANIEVENTAILILQDYSTQEVSGNGDGDIDPGEQWDMPVTLYNRGISANDVSGTLSSPALGVTIQVPVSSFGTIAAESAATGVPSYRATLAPGSTADGLRFDIQVDDEGETNLQLVLGVNDFLEVFRWTHDNVSSGYGDQWHISTQRNHTPGGSYSWKCGRQGVGNYNDHLDSALETRSISLATVDAVRFWHLIDAEDDVNGTAWDGGVIEVAIDGGPWSSITPDGGYPYTIIPNPDSPFPGGTPCFSGTFGWSQVRVDLSALIGDEVRLRFRFGSDGAVTEEGWYLDDFSTEGANPSAVEDLDPTLSRLTLAPPRPNPARDGVTIRFVQPPLREVRLDLVDVTGRHLRSWAFPGSAVGSGSAITREIRWDGRTSDGSTAGSGIFFVRLTAGNETRSQRLVWIP